MVVHIRVARLEEEFCVCAQSLIHVQPLVTPWTVAHQAPLFMEFSRQEYWRKLPFPTPGDLRVSCTGRQILYHLAIQEVQRGICRFPS